MAKLSEIGGRRMPLLRWSFVRMMLGMRHLTREWQVGDGREEALRAYVLEHAREGDLDDVIRVIDEFCYEQSFMINVGDEKGALLDDALRRTEAKLILELGTYCGYSALRMARVMSAGARIVSVEFLAANADIARAIWRHAGIDERATVVVGTLGDGGATADRLEQDHGFAPGSLDFVFLDHDKNAYVPDLELLLDRGWLHPGTMLVADNVKLPGAPKYRAFMTEHEGNDWRTVEHLTHAEYQTLLKDLVLESEYLGDGTPAR
jgi:catechol O-methyltransferase